eukprot:gene47216-66957_t
MGKEAAARGGAVAGVDALRDLRSGRVVAVFRGPGAVARAVAAAAA